MSEDLIALYFWLSGWIILTIGYYIYKVYIDHDHKVTKKVHAWRAFWTGAWSWVGIFFVFAFLVVGGLSLLNDWIERKLNNK
jgi:hypothetical protein